MFSVLSMLESTWVHGNVRKIFAGYYSVHHAPGKQAHDRGRAKSGNVISTRGSRADKYAPWAKGTEIFLRM